MEYVKKALPLIVYLALAVPMFYFAEEGIVQLQGQRTAVYDLAEIRFREGFHDGYGAFVPREQAGRIVAGEAFAGPATVRGSSQITGKPQIVHGGAGSGPEAAAPFVPASFQGF